MPLIALEILTGLYVLGVWRCWLRAGVNHGVRWRQVIAYAGALISLLIALISPLDGWAEELFSFHMVQHLILILIAAPLLIWSDYPQVFLYALPRKVAHRLAQGWHNAVSVRGMWRVVTNPIGAWTLFTALLWLWHLPVPYQAALENDLIHGIEHACFVAAALVFWWVLLKPNAPVRTRYAVAIPYLFLSSIQGGLLGALLTFSTQVWYPVYEQHAAAWQITALQDQQIAGLIMWLPVGALFTILAAVYILLWLAALESEQVKASGVS